MPTHPEPATEPPRRRADAERSIARILDAALDALASDPDASMAEIARRARVVRATIYVHFPTRDALIDAVTHRAMHEVSAAIDAAEPERGDAVDAFAAFWRPPGASSGATTPSSPSPPSSHTPNCAPSITRSSPASNR